MNRLRANTYGLLTTAHPCNNPYNAWFSEKQKVLCGTYWYITPEGYMVEVTEVAQGEYPAHWPDAVYIGQVTYAVCKEYQGLIYFDFKY